MIAENKVYGEDVLCEAPTLSKVEAEEGKLVLTFEHAGDGLYLSEEVPYGQKIGKERLGGLQVFQDGQELESGSLKAQAEVGPIL